MTQQYLNSKYSKKLKAALIGVDAFTFSEGNISKNCYTLFYPFYEDKNVNDYLKKTRKTYRILAAQNHPVVSL